MKLTIEELTRMLEANEENPPVELLPNGDIIVKKEWVPIPRKLREQSGY